MMFTDPPYGVAYRDTGAGAWDATKLAKKKAGTLRPRFEAIENDEMGGEVLTKFWTAFLKAAVAVLADKAAVYCCFASLRAPEVFAAYRAAGLEPRAELVWVKSRPGFNFAQYKHQHEPILYGGRTGKPISWYGDRAQTSTLHVASESGAVYVHPTQKPVALLRQPIINSSQAGGVIYEPFAGSATTLIACHLMNRRFRGLELSPIYVDVGVLRWQEFAKQQATLSGDGRTFDEIAKARSGRKHAAKPVQVRPAPRSNGLRADGMVVAAKPGGNPARAVVGSHERPGAVRMRKGTAGPGQKGHRKPVSAPKTKGGPTEPP